MPRRIRWKLGRHGLLRFRLFVLLIMICEKQSMEIRSYAFKIKFSNRKTPSAFYVHTEGLLLVIT